MNCPYCMMEIENELNCQFCGRAFEASDFQWWMRLSSYNYPVNLNHFAGRNRYPNYFTLEPNNRISTMQFEDHFRQALMSSELNIAPFLEVIYWKMYSQGREIKEKQTTNMEAFLSTDVSKSVVLKKRILNFASDLSRENATHLISACGFKTDVIATAFTFPAFYRPDLFPMVDTRVAKWVNHNLAKKNLRNEKLIPFQMKFSSLRMEDFDAYQCWIEWCREKAFLLNELQPKVNWRPRDVEMACFSDITYKLPRL